MLAAIAYGFVVLRVSSWLPRESALAAAVIMTGLIGVGGNVAYGFETIHRPHGRRRRYPRHIALVVAFGSLVWSRE